MPRTACYSLSNSTYLLLTCSKAVKQKPFNGTASAIFFTVISKYIAALRKNYNTFFIKTSVEQIKTCDF